MIRRFQALGYRCLRYVDLELDSFQVLVGANASGKSTLFDALTLLGDLVEDGAVEAVAKRTSNFQDLVWNRPDKNLAFELAVEIEVPATAPSRCHEDSYDRLRYEVEVREDRRRGLHIAREQWFPLTAAPAEPRSGDRFPDPPTPPLTLFTPFGEGNRPSAPGGLPGGGDRTPLEIEYPGDPKTNGDWARSALDRLPIVQKDFPVQRWLRNELKTVASVSLDSDALRQPSRPNPLPLHLERDGSNLPWLVERLKKEHRDLYEEWLAHVATAIPEIRGVDTVLQPWDRRLYLVVRYESGLSAPSWSISEGTLRLLALTLPAYLPYERRVNLVEEPENGIHPLAMDAMYASLSSGYSFQLLAATHSPVLVRLSHPEDLLCFGQDQEGATDIVRGYLHPMLKGRREETDPTLLFATGVIG